jgi:predicted Rossmann fold nucleotide-binding protein DprA/Smf involved in DNA uptake
MSDDTTKALRELLGDWTRTDLETALALARTVMLGPERARERGVPYDRSSAQLVTRLAGIVEAIAQRLLARLPPRPERPDRSIPAAHRAQLLRALEDGPKQIDELIDLLGCDNKAVWQVVGRARKAGHAIRYEDGCYSLERQGGEP